MSLNGLDNPAVIEAYQTTLAEAGGWFLLKYVSRDEVALLGRGTGGVPEVRNTIDGYDENSPLYGFLQYRRRKVVLRYMPEGLSRLIQARTTVQFQSILDKFSPHDTVFSLAQPSELTESALSSACLLHAASGSITSSSSSLRRRRLMEITEDAEENAAAKDEAPPQSPESGIRQRSFSQLSEATVVPPRFASNAESSPNVDGTQPALKKANETSADDQLPSTPEHASELSSPRKNLLEELSQPSIEPRKSSQSARPSLRDLEQLAGYSPKVKRGPRPSLDTNGRPRTAGNLSRSQDQRPVASLPAGVRSSSRKSVSEPSRPQSQRSAKGFMTINGSPPVPPLLVPPPSIPISRPQLSPGAKSMSALSSSGMTPEKERLMKALQQRKKQMEKRAEQARRKQTAAEEQQQARLDADENKENIDHTQEKFHQDEAEDMADEIVGKEYPSEAQSSTASTSVTDPVGAKPGSPELSKPDSAVDMTVGDLEGDRPSNASVPSVSTTTSTDFDEPLETAFSQTPQKIHEEETEAAQGEPAVSSQSETKDSADPPSAGDEVPLKALEETASAPQPTEEMDVPDEQEVNTPRLAPATIPLPETPDQSQPSGSAADISTPIVSESVRLQQNLTPEASDDTVQQTLERKAKRKPNLDPIQVPPQDYSDDDNLLSDDSFMEELKSATVEEAKPVSVGKSPLSPPYSNSEHAQEAWRNTRAVSNPSAVGHQTPDLQALTVGRSVSSSYSESHSPTVPVLVAKKINVSSGISKRIKALEKFSSSRETSSNSSHNLGTPSASSSFENLRKRASISLGSGHAESTSSSKHTSYLPETFSRAPSVKRNDSPHAERGTNSVSVTAGIVRDTNTLQSESTHDASESNTVNLQPSPLIVENERSETPHSQGVAEEPAPNKSEKRSMSTSSASSTHNSLTAMMSRSDSRLSVSSRSKVEGVHQSRCTGDLASPPEEKKESRASRLLRRMSSITSNSRKNVRNALSPSPSLKEEDTSLQSKNELDTPEAPRAVDIGEVNVQFPDTLLWKRRFMRIDDNGFLVLTPGNIDSSARNMIKRYHLSEFRTPCLPDEDMQELPNSILLDFLDGSTLQCACESRQGQASVLRTLVDAHSAYQRLG